MSTASTNAGAASRGVTLIEMMIVVSVIALAAAITMPAINSGVDSLRLSSASDAVVSFFNSGLNRAERRQEIVEIVVSRAGNLLVMRSEHPEFVRRLHLPEGVSIVRFHPENIEDPEEEQRSFVLYPAGTVPRFGVEIQNRRGARRIVSVDPITGVPQVQTPEQQ